MRVLVTGASGFLGGALARALAAAGHEVEGIGTRHPSAVVAPGFHYRQQACEDVVEVGDVVVHAAGTSDVAYAHESPRRAAEDTVIGTIALLEAAARAGAFAVVLSTQSVYGATEPSGVYSEDRPIAPRSLYGALKAAQEHVALSYRRAHALGVVICRLCNVYGPRERPGALVRTFLEAALEGRAVQVEGDGLQQRSLLHVDDLCEAVVRLVSMRVGPEVMNLAGPDFVSVRELADRCNEVARRLGRPGGLVVTAPARSHEEGHVVLDVQLAMRTLGWTPRVRLAEGLETTARWLLANGAMGAEEAT